MVTGTTETHPPPILNFEIWAHIASFLTLSQLWDMRYLNKAMYDLAMDAGYRDVHICLDYGNFPGFGRKFARVYDTQPATRWVRKLEFSHFQALHHTHGINWSSRKGRDAIPEDYLFFLPPLSMGNFQSRTSESEELETLKQTIRKFHLVSSVWIDLCQYHTNKEQLLLSSFGITTFSSTLTSLSINFHYEMVSYLIPKAILLPCLRDLSFRMEFDMKAGMLRGWAGGGVVPLMTTVEALSDFVNGHAHLLKSLAIHFPMDESGLGTHQLPPVLPTWQTPHLSVVYSRLVPFRRLDALSFDISRQSGTHFSA
ncbi:hypothetical protein D9613_002294 [Agrocybe pediades]|uniref:F-box domain-containing protein n=1 Tax=Agrocybe pediades TaxID=84607 RepID=A0A8H4R490_9AGAR|nr:hypothetical protein D9613_002294 [Agrocybe pediades]